MTVLALMIALSMQASYPDAASAADGPEVAAAVAQAAMADAVRASNNAVLDGLAADLSSQGDERAGVLQATVEDRVAACRQARFIQARADEAAVGMADSNPAFDALALIHLWAGFTVNRNCGEPVGDPAA